MDVEDQNQDVIPGAWRNDKVLLDVYHEKARNAGTKEGGKLEDTWATTLPQWLVLCLSRTR